MPPQSLGILHVHSSLHWGGGEDQLLLLIRGQLELGHSVVLLCADQGMLAERASAAGINVHTYSLKSVGRRGAPTSEMLSLRSSNRIDIVHGHDSLSVSLVGTLGRKLGIPAVITRRIASPLRRNWLSRRKYSPARLSAIISISDTVRREVRKTGFPENRLYIVPDALDFSYLETLDSVTGLREKYGAEQLAVGIGTLSVKKDWATLLKTAARLKESRPGLRWLLAGEGSEREALEGLVESLGLRETVFLLGFRKDADALLCSADFLFFPSWREGASVTVRKAMALSVPVVAADSAGVVESLDGCGVLFPVRDDAAAAQAVSALLDDKAKRKILVQQALDSAQKRFCSDRSAVCTGEIYTHLIRDHRRRR